MDQLISVINELRETFSALGIPSNAIPLPIVAVVGQQSSGKSSVIESILARQFLPRGQGIVTRRPLILQLRPSKLEYGEFGHKKSQKFEDFSKIRQEIEDETAKGTTSSFDISDIPIFLSIYSPNVMEMTLVDLPGLVTLEVSGQPPETRKLIKQSILKYIQEDNCIILAVSSATQDLATSAGLKLARSVDPAGNRTIGVLTKLDLVVGKDYMRELQNQVFKLKLGFCGIVNRLEDAISTQAEHLFFQSHPKYSTLLPDIGTQYLQTLISTTLKDHILYSWPKLKRDINNIMSDTVLAIRGLENDDNDAATIFSTIKDELVRNFEIKIKAFNSEHASDTQEDIGCLIHNVYLHKFQEVIKNVTPEESELKSRILYKIKNSDGNQPSNWINELAAHSIIKFEISKFNDTIVAALQLINELFHDAIKMDSTYYPTSVSRYPVLKTRIHNLLHSLLEEQRVLCEAVLLNFISSEKAFIRIAWFANDNSCIQSENVESIPNCKTKSIKTKHEEPFHAGFLNITTIPDIGINTKKLWTVVDRLGLHIYSDIQEEICQMQILLDSTIKLEMLKKNFMSQCLSFRLRADGTDAKINENCDCIILKTTTEKDALPWFRAIIRAGAAAEKNTLFSIDKDIKNYDNLIVSDPPLQRKVNSIHDTVVSYMAKETDFIRNALPGFINHNLVNTFIDRLRPELQKLYPKVTDMMQLGSEDLLRLQKLQKQRAFCTKALARLEDIELRF